MIVHQISIVFTFCLCFEKVYKHFLKFINCWWWVQTRTRRNNGCQTMSVLPFGDGKVFSEFLLFGQAKGFACAEKVVNPATSFDEKKTKEKTRKYRCLKRYPQLPQSSLRAINSFTFTCFIFNVSSSILFLI